MSLRTRRHLVLAVALGLATALSPASACASTPAAPGQASTSSTATPSAETSSTPPASTPATNPGSKLPQFDHVLLVMFENKKEGSIIGNPDAPFINSLAAGGANFTQSYAITHPSQPNYLALFSGSTHGVSDDNCGYSFTANNQAHEMLKAGLTFTSYAEDLPAPGSLVCTSGEYARKHAPWTDFPNVPASAQQPYTSFPSDYTKLPDVSWVIPNLCDDMHDCSIGTGDSWLQANLGGYASWALDHNSLLIVTFDEDDSSGPNQIATIFYGANVVPGSYSEHITHYTVLRTMEDLYGVPRLGLAKQAKTIKDVWK